MAITLRTSGSDSQFTANTTITVTGLSVTAGDIIVGILSAHSSASTVSVTDSLSTTYTDKGEEQFDVNHGPVRIAWGEADTTTTVTVTGTFDATSARKSMVVLVFNPDGATITEDFYAADGSGFVSADTQVSVGNENVESSDAVAIFGAARAGAGNTTWNSLLIAGSGVDGSVSPATTTMVGAYTIFSATDTGVAAAVTPATADRYQMVFLGLQGAAVATLTDVNLVDLTGTAQSSLTSLRWSWFDVVTPGSFVAPTDQGTTESTDGSGNITLNLPNSLLSSGQDGCLVLRDSANSYIGAYRLTTD